MLWGLAGREAGWTPHPFSHSFIHWWRYGDLGSIRSEDIGYRADEAASKIPGESLPIFQPAFYLAQHAHGVQFRHTTNIGKQGDDDDE